MIGEMELLRKVRGNPNGFNLTTFMETILAEEKQAFVGMVEKLLDVYSPSNSEKNNNEFLQDYLDDNRNVMLKFIGRNLPSGIQTSQRSVRGKLAFIFFVLFCFVLILFITV